MARRTTYIILGITVGILVVAVAAALAWNAGALQPARLTIAKPASSTTPEPRPTPRASTTPLSGTPSDRTAAPAVAPTAAAASRSQPSPSVDALLALLPAEALERSVQEMRLNDERLVYVRYKVPSQVASSGIGPAGGIMVVEREFHELYQWQGAWRRVFNVYDWAQVFFQLDELGPIVDGRPRTGTAVVQAKLYPLNGETRSGDYLVLETGLMVGPTGRQHYTPTVAVFSWDGRELVSLWRRQFLVRGGIVAVRARDGGVELVMPANLKDDPACCPRGWEQLALVPNPLVRALRVSRSCVTEQYSDCLSLGPRTPTPPAPTRSPAPTSTLRPGTSPDTPVAARTPTAEGR